MIPIIMDVDTGIDDAIALMMAVASDRIDLLGVTTVSGNVPVHDSTRNTIRLLKCMGRTDIPVHRGSASPMKRPLVDARAVHGHNGLNNQLTHMDIAVPEDETALAFLEQQIRTRPGEIILISTGPLTNIARLLEKSPDLVPMISKVVSMGGVVSGKGNHTPVAEFNFLTDPEAADRVLSAGIGDLTLITLDVTRKALLHRTWLSELTDPSVRTFLSDLTTNYMDRHAARTGIDACAMHDGLTVLHVLDSGLVRTQQEHVVVETESRYCDGMTVCDWDGIYHKKPNAHVSVHLEPDRFQNRMMELLGLVEWEE